MNARQSVVLCEGYHDRAFWAGWLMHLGCVDPGEPEEGSTRRRPVEDPWRNAVESGQFGYRSKRGGFVRVVPCRGKNNVLPAARIRLAQSRSKGLTGLVVCMDSDIEAGGVDAGAEPSTQAVEQVVREFDANAARNEEGDWLVNDGAIAVSVVQWAAPDAEAAGLPSKQTLERLVCAAMIAAYPKRAPAVQTWLDSRPEPPGPDVKEFAWSYMAGWYAEGGCEFFYRGVWQDEAIASELENRLQTSGAWRVAERLAEQD